MANRPTFLDEPPTSEAGERLYADDIETDGYVGNMTSLWTWRPEVHEQFAAAPRARHEGLDAQRSRGGGPGDVDRLGKAPVRREAVNFGRSPG